MRGANEAVVVAVLLGLASCDRAPCEYGHALDEHPFAARNAVMVFTGGGAALFDVAHHTAYGVAEFSGQASRLLKDVDAKARANRLDSFKSTVSVAGYAYTCSVWGGHKVVVTSMTASDLAQYTDHDFEALQKTLQEPSGSAPPLPAKCQPSMT